MSGTSTSTKANKIRGAKRKTSTRIIPVALTRFYIKHLRFGAKKKRALMLNLISKANMGRPFTTSLEELYEIYTDDGRAPNNTTAFILREWWSNVTKSNMEYGTAAEYWFSKEQVVLINSGAGTAKFTQCLKSIVYGLEKRGVVMAALRKGLLIPIIVFAMGLSLPVAFDIELVPVLRSLPGFVMTSPVSNLAAFGHFIISDWPETLGILAVISAIVGYTMPRIVGEPRKYLDKIPPWSFYRIVQGSNFMLSLAALAASGMPRGQALERIAANNLTPYMRERVGAVLRRMELGERIGTALMNTGYEFPSRPLAITLRSYETDPDFDKMLQDVATESLDDSVKAIVAQSAIASSIIGLLTGYVLLTFVSAYNAVAMSATNMH